VPLVSFDDASFNASLEFARKGVSGLIAKQQGILGKMLLKQ
jgi:hypothetical protein